MKTAIPHGDPAWARNTTIGDLDGALDKCDSATEGQESYAATLYRELRDNLKGTAYSRNSDDLQHCENIACARLYAGLMRMADRQVNNTLPSTADEKLEYWVEVLAAPTRASDSREQIRKQCAAYYRLLEGPRKQVIEDAFAACLGDLYVKTHWITGTDLANPPTNTYWPTANPGPSQYDLGGGAWLSERMHITIEVNGPHVAGSLADFYELVNTQLFRVGQRILPATATFDWACNVEDGYELDVDQMDFAGGGEATS